MSIMGKQGEKLSTDRTSLHPRSFREAIKELLEASPLKSRTSTRAPDSPTFWFSAYARATYVHHL